MWCVWSNLREDQLGYHRAASCSTSTVLSTPAYPATICPPSLRDHHCCSNTGGDHLRWFSDTQLTCVGSDSKISGSSATLSDRTDQHPSWRHDLQINARRMDRPHRRCTATIS